jgi:hypothetical protein
MLETLFQNYIQAPWQYYFDNNFRNLEFIYILLSSNVNMLVRTKPNLNCNTKEEMELRSTELVSQLVQI